MPAFVVQESLSGKHLDPFLGSHDLEKRVERISAIRVQGLLRPGVSGCNRAVSCCSTALKRGTAHEGRCSGRKTLALYVRGRVYMVLYLSGDMRMHSVHPFSSSGLKGSRWISMPISAYASMTSDRRGSSWVDCLVHPLCKSAVSFVTFAMNPYNCTGRTVEPGLQVQRFFQSGLLFS